MEVSLTLDIPDNKVAFLQDALRWKYELTGPVTVPVVKEIFIRHLKEVCRDFKLVLEDEEARHAALEYFNELEIG